VLKRLISMCLPTVCCCSVAYFV